MSERTIRSVNRAKSEFAKNQREYQALPADASEASLFVLSGMIKSNYDFAIETLSFWESDVEKTKTPKKADAEALINADYDDDKEGLSHIISELARYHLTLQTRLPKKEKPAPTPVVIQNKTPEVHLPTIRIQKFNGDKRQFTSFWQTFTQTIGKRDIPNAQKLAYLLQFLEGEALDSVSGFEATDENYDTVTATLKYRFDDAQGRCRLLMDDLYALQTAPEEYPVLRQITDKLIMIIRQLQAAGVSVDFEFVHDLIESKLPSQLKRILITERLKDPDQWTCNTALKLITDDMAIRQRLHTDETKPKSTPIPTTVTPLARPKLTFSQQQRLPPVSSMPSNQTTNQTHATPPNNIKLRSADGSACLLCNDASHKPSRCPRYPTVDQRKRQLEYLLRCGRCCQTGHATNECTRLLYCKWCHQRTHQTLLCPTSHHPTVSALGVDESSSPESTKAALMVRHVNAVNPVTFQTASLVVLLDSGSQQTFITDCATKRLHLRRENEHLSTVTGVGNHSCTEKTSNVEFMLKTSDGYMNIAAETKKTLTPPVPLIVLPSQVTATTQLNSAEVDMQCVDVIIGAEYFHLVFQSTKVVNNEITIAQTKFGDFYCGKVPIPTATTTFSGISIQAEQPFGQDKLFNLPEFDDIDEDALVQKEFDESIEKIDGHYQVRLRFRPTQKPLKSNLGLAHGRLKSLHNKLLKTPELLEQYNEEIAKMEKQGTVESAPPTSHNQRHYIAHQFILKVLLPSGRCLTRPINLLIPLEVHFASRECRDEHESVDTLGPEAAPTTTHPSCLATTADTTTATMTPDTGLSDDATSSSRTTDTLNPPQGYTQRPPRCSHHAGHTADYGSTR